MTTLAIVIASGVVIGLLLGGLGGGGAVLAVPMLVYLVGLSAQEAVTISLTVVGISAAINTLARHHDRHVNWKLGGVFALVGVGTSYLGTLANTSVPEHVLLASFVALLLVSASSLSYRVVHDVRVARRATVQQRELQGAGVGARGPVLGPTVTDIGGFCPLSASPRRSDRWRCRGVVVASAALVGFLTGFLGVGGGFIVVPALVLLLGQPMTVATGTSLLIITLNSATSLAARVHTGLEIDWSIVVPFTVSTVALSFVGRAVARRISATVLTGILAVTLLLVSLGISAELAFLD